MPNRIEDVGDGTSRVYFNNKLGLGRFVLVDTVDVCRIEHVTWQLTRHAKWGQEYAKGQLPAPTLTKVKASKGRYGSRVVYVALHRLLLCFPLLQVDHKDGNTLNNSRSNLRLATNAHNQYNTPPRKLPNASSRYKGVSRDGRLFVARIAIGGKEVYSKGVTDEREAAVLYDTWARELFGEFAWLNTKHFPELSHN